MFNVILIDDEPIVLEYLSEGFDWKSLNFTVKHKFTDAREALEFMKKNPIDAVITDIYMPNMSGIEFARMCYEMYPHIYIVFFSAYEEFEYAKKAIEYGVFAYVTKPISYDEFNSMLKKLSARLSSGIGQIENENITKNESTLVRSCVDFMKAHYAEQITLNDIARFVALSPAYVSTRYRQLSGESIISTLNSIRINEAKRIIQNGNVKVYAICEEVGFNSYSYFEKVFRQLCGVSPTEYGKQFRHDL